MNQQFKVVLLSLGALGGLMGCDSGIQKLADPDIRILWTNDTHGFLSPNYHREEGDDAYVERAPQEGKLGGMAYIATLVKRQRGEQPGKTILGQRGYLARHHRPVASQRPSVLEVMNAIGYDAMTSGNVEFIYPQKTLTGLIRMPSSRSWRPISTISSSANGSSYPICVRIS